MAALVALSVVALTVAAALVLDFGIIRMDRQLDKLAADDAVAAGLNAADSRDTGDVFNSRGVCAALDFLKANRPELAGLPPCTVNAAQKCSAATPASYSGTVAASGRTFQVWIAMPYRVGSTLGGGVFPEESLGTLAADTGDSTQAGCDQLAVVVQQTNKVGLARILSKDHLVTRVRSVGRVVSVPGQLPPALLLLARHRCSVLSVGSAGSPSQIRVMGAGSVPGTIHSDSDATGSDCGSGSNQQLFQGKQTDGIVAYGAAGAPGTVSSVATMNGVPSSTVYDSTYNVHGTTATTSADAGTSSPVVGRKLVTRKIVDTRYANGVRAAIGSASPLWSLNPAAPGPGWTRVGCTPTAAELSSATSGLYVDCPSNSGITLTGTVNARSVFLNGFLKGGALSMPNATAVYVNNTASSGYPLSTSAVSLSGTGDCLAVRSSSCSATPAAQCSSATSSGRAQLFVRQGTLGQNGGVLRLCNTTVYELGGQTTTGCVPADNLGTNGPSSTPCAGSSGNGQLVVNGGVQDWTAPNQAGSLAPLTRAARQALWDSGEDLALWTESYGGSSSGGYSLGGGGALRVTGIFITPNAAPFTLAGSSSQTLSNAQFVAASFVVKGGSTLTMTVDPDNTVPLPDNRDTLIR